MRYCWPAACPSPTVWFALRERHLAYQIKVARLQGPAAWRLPRSSQPCALLAARRAAALHILVPLDATGVASSDQALFVRTIVPPRCGDGAAAAAATATQARQLQRLARLASAAAAAAAAAPQPLQPLPAELQQTSPPQQSLLQQQQSAPSTASPPLPQPTKRSKILSSSPLAHSAPLLAGAAVPAGCQAQQPDCQATLSCRCTPVVIDMGPAEAPAEQPKPPPAATSGSSIYSWLERFRGLASSMLGPAPSSAALYVH
ncbi:hypothetical protein ABPG75_000568 [Micractinium tetrahymenae]